MTKLEQLKKDIGYTKVNKQCQNCKHFSKEELMNEWSQWEDKNLKCSLYGFATKKTTVCDKHEKKETK